MKTTTQKKVAGAARGGFTFVELIFTIIIIGILGYAVVKVVAPSTVSMKIDEAAMKDADAVATGLMRYREKSSTSNGTFSGANAEAIEPHIMAEMPVVGTGATSYLESMYYGDSVKIYVASDTDSDANNRRAKVFVDASAAAAENEWGTKGCKLYQENLIKALKDKFSLITVVHTATAITDDMSASAAGATGTNDDAIIGIGNFKY